MVGNRLVAKARDPSPLVRCELVVALCGFIFMYFDRHAVLIREIKRNYKLHY